MPRSIMEAENFEVQKGMCGCVHGPVEKETFVQDQFPQSLSAEVKWKDIKAARSCGGYAKSEPTQTRT